MFKVQQKRSRNDYWLTMPTDYEDIATATAEANRLILKPIKSNYHAARVIRNQIDDDPAWPPEVLYLTGGSKTA